jgi:cyclohexa-1,5-dienecarbonyl-CoA hydratase
MENLVRLNHQGSRADLTLNRPPKNLLNVEMLEQLVNHLDHLREDESLKVLVIKGAAGVFCSGIELGARTTEEAGVLMPVFTRVFDFINQIRGITIAVVEGEASDGGFELASYCDIVFAADSATFCLPEITLGLFPPIAAAILPRLVGRNKTIEWLVSGNRITAQEAMDAGLVNRVWPAGRLQDEAEKFAARVNSFSAPAVVWTKRAIDRGLYAPVRDGMRSSESIYMLELMRNLDPHEGIKAAIEGRKPNWRNMYPADTAPLHLRKSPPRRNHREAGSSL